MRKWLKKYSIGLWAFSLLLAVMLWAFVKWNLNPENEKTLELFPVFSGEDGNLADQELCIIEGKEQSYRIVFMGRQSDLNRLNKDNVSLVVDVTHIYSAGIAYPGSEVVLPDDLLGRIEVRQLPSVSVRIDKVIRKNVEVKAQNYGVASDYLAREPVIMPPAIAVTGPATVLDTIAVAEVDVARTNLSASVESEFPYRFMTDSKEPVVATEQLETDVDTVHVTIAVELTKELSLDLTLNDGGGLKRDENISLEITPQKILVSGSAEDLDRYDKITLDTLDLAEVEEDFQKVYQILLPDGLRNESGATEAEVTLEIKGVEQADVTTTNLRIINDSPPPGCRATLVTEQLAIKIRGPASVVSRVQPSHVRVEVDLQGVELDLGKRQFTAEVKIYVDGFTEVGVMGSYSVLVDVAEIQEETS